MRPHLKLAAGACVAVAALVYLIGFSPGAAIALVLVFAFGYYQGTHRTLRS